MARSDPAIGNALAMKPAMKLAGMIVERRNTIPVLSCVSLAAPGRLDATDLDISISVTFDAKEYGLTDAAIAVPRHLLAAALRDTDGSMAVCGGTNGRFLRIGSNPSVRLLANGDDLPRPAAFDPTVTFNLPADQLAADLAVVSPAMSEEETRYYLMGMFWHVVDAQLRFAATDGHRLHRISQPVPDGAVELPESIIPRKAVEVLAEALSAQPGVGAVKVEVASLRMRFTVGAVTLTTRLIDGTFPDYRRVIPETAKGGLKLAARELMRPATLASRLLGKNRPCMVLRPKDGTVHAKCPEGIEIEARLDRELIGEAVEEVGFRHDYLLEALAPFTGAVVTMAMDDAASPCRIDCESNSRLLVVLMPMRV